MLRQQIRAVSSLLSTMTLIGLCVGMTSTLLGLRGTMEGFSTITIGLIMSAYFVGYLFGASRAPKDIRRVGYIRAFGGLAALSSVAVLVQAIWIDPVVWFVMRFVSGFAISALFVIAESWLNTMADNRNRGAMLSVYLVLIYGGLVVGQLILGFADPATFVPFALIAMLINLSLIPILATVTVEPTTHEAKKVPLKLLIEQAPLGIVTAFIVQACSAMFYGVGPVYATAIGLSVSQVTIFMAAFLFGGMIIQTPIGLLSDKFDRRIVLGSCALTAAALALVLAQIPGSQPLLIYIVMILLGGSLLPLYSLAMAHTNDYLTKDQMIGATGAIIKTGGVGAIVGAPLAAILMQLGNVNFFFVLMAVFTTTVAVYAFYRVTQRAKATEQVHSPLMGIAPAQPSEELLASLVEEANEDFDEPEGNIPVKPGSNGVV